MAGAGVRSRARSAPGVQAFRPVVANARLEPSGCSHPRGDARPHGRCPGPVSVPVAHQAPGVPAGALRESSGGPQPQGDARPHGRRPLHRVGGAPSAQAPGPVPRRSRPAARPRRPTAPRQRRCPAFVSALTVHQTPGRCGPVPRWSRSADSHPQGDACLAGPPVFVSAHAVHQMPGRSSRCEASDRQQPPGGARAPHFRGAYAWRPCARGPVAGSGTPRTGSSTAGPASSSHGGSRESGSR